jgi:MFS family permease
MPVSWGGIMFPWESYQSLLPLLLGFFGTIGFLFYEHYIPKNPMVRIRVFIPRSAAVNYFGTTIHGIILWCMLYYLPLYYEAVKGYSATMTGVAIFPETFTVAPVVVLTGILVSVTGRYRWALWGGWTLTTLGLGILYLLDVQTTVVQFVFLNLVPGIGTGMLFPSTEYAIQAAVAESDSGLAMTMFTFVRALGQSIGVAIGGVIFQSRLRIELSKYPAVAASAEEYARDASALVRIIKGMPSESVERASIVQAYADSLKVVWAVMAGLAAVAGLLSLLTEGLSLDRELDTEQGFVDSEKDKSKSEPLAKGGQAQTEEPK